MQRAKVIMAAGVLTICLLGIRPGAKEQAASSPCGFDHPDLVSNVLGVGEVYADDKPEYSGFLEDYSGFVDQPDKNLISNYAYQNPDRDLSGCTIFLIDSVTVFPDPDADFKGINANDLTLLEKHFHESMVQALTEGDAYEVVDEPGPGVCRIRVAITDLVPVQPTMNTLTTYVPQMRLMSGLVGAATGSNMFVGQIGIEAEFIDAESHERIAAVVSKQAGKKYVPFSGREMDSTSEWGQVKQAMDYWAQKLRTRLDADHGKTTDTSDESAATGG